MTTALYYSPGACSFAPHVVLREIGLPFELRKFATADRRHLSPEYLAVNPKGQIPALLIDGFVLTENPAILAYLGRKYSAAGVYPSDASRDEARCLELLAWSSNTAHVAYAQVLRPERFAQSSEAYDFVKASGHSNFQRCLSEIDAHLAQNKLAVANRFSVVDPYWLVFFRWGAREGYDMKNQYPSYCRYVDALCERPTIARALQVEGITVWP